MILYIYKEKKKEREACGKHILKIKFGTTIAKVDKREDRR